MIRNRLAFLGVLAVTVPGTQTLSAQQPPSEARRIEQARLERIPTADLGNGYYRNPVMVGPGSDNSVVRVGSDFYLIAAAAASPTSWSGTHATWSTGARSGAP